MYSQRRAVKMALEKNNNNTVILFMMLIVTGVLTLK